MHGTVSEMRSAFSNNQRMRTIGLVLIVFFSLVLAAGIGALLGYYTSGYGFKGGITEVFQPAFDGKRTVWILVLGEDNTGGTESKPAGLADTIILAYIDLDAGQVSALSIPRDTRVDFGGYGDVHKINAAHVVGGPALTALAVEELTGIKPDYYIKTNVEGFVKSVDILGGVEIDVEKNMRYTDRWGGLYINLKKGRQVLDGDKAMQYVRFRHDALGDIARIERQQKFLKALTAKALSPVNLPKFPGVLDALMRNVDTDLSPKDLVCMAKFASRLDMDRVKTATLPGTPETIGGISYWIPDYEKIQQVVQGLFFSRFAAGLPRVEVLNGSGISGAAQKVADVLMQQGYEVTAVGNADSFDYASTRIVNHRSDVQGIDRIQNVMGPGVVEQGGDPSAEADVTVIVGRDCVLLGLSD